MVLLFLMFIPFMQGSDMSDMPQYINEAARLEYAGLEDPAAYIAKRNARIHGEIETILKQGYAPPGTTLHDNSVTVSAEKRPDLIRLDQVLLHQVRWWLEENEGDWYQRKLGERGMSKQDFLNLEKSLYQLGTYNKFIAKKQAPFWKTQEKMIALDEFEDDQIFELLCMYERIVETCYTEWPEMILNSLTLQGRRVLLAYVFEFEGIALSVNHQIPKIDQQRIQSYKQSLIQAKDKQQNDL